MKTLITSFTQRKLFEEVLQDLEGINSWFLPLHFEDEKEIKIAENLSDNLEKMIDVFHHHIKEFDKEQFKK